MGSEQHRFPPPPQQHQPPPPPPPLPRTSGHKRWVGCWGGLSCFGRQKGGKRIVPSSRIPDANSLGNQPNGPQVGGVNNQTTGLAPHLFAPPSSPASFSHSALPSTAQSPSCFLSANSPGGPSSSMYATGPYAHETQLVSPPVFSTFTTEPSTAPLTPPPELAHLTTPSSPDVPYARFLSSSAGIKATNKTNFVGASDLHSAYSLYPESPASNFRSPSSRNTGDCLPSPYSPQYDPSAASRELRNQESDLGGLYGLERAGTSKLSPQDSNFFCPATFAQFYDHSFPLSGGRLSVSKESDAHSNAGNGHQNCQNKNCKQDAEEIEAYRASFGFSADEIVSTAQYVEISDVVLNDSFSMTPYASNKSQEQENIEIVSADKRRKAEKAHKNIMSPVSPQYCKSGSNIADVPDSNMTDNCSKKNPGDAFGPGAPAVSDDDDDIFSKMGNSRLRRKYHLGLSSSDAEIEYRRGRSLREGKGGGAWRG